MKITATFSPSGVNERLAGGSPRKEDPNESDLAVWIKIAENTTTPEEELEDLEGYYVSDKPESAGDTPEDLDELDRI